jgi:hypothetical protein
MIDTLSHVSFVRLVVALWAIWWARLMAIHDEIFQSPSATHVLICRFFDELNMEQVKSSFTTVVLDRKMVRPKAPPPGVKKIHVDMATARNHVRGASAAVY